MTTQSAVLPTWNVAAGTSSLMDLGVGNTALFAADAFSIHEPMPILSVAAAIPEQECR
jgi:hypothetical protein